MDKEQKRKEITDRILSAGGEVVHVVGAEEEMDMLLAKGQFFEGDTSIVEGGKAMLCHDNSLKFYLENKGMRLCTGYAANKTQEDKFMWVKHSWCVDEDGIVHECTPEKRDKYFGAIMDEREAEKFRRETDYAYDAECRRREALEKENIALETSEPKKGIRGWLKKIILKIKGLDKPTLCETNQQKQEENQTTLVTSLQQDVNTCPDYSFIEEQREKTTGEQVR